jgi:UDP-N-acetylglucosamine--N-acetylmuramyl-(pentapeptide) pyrophosphoryl-undecaprenol N-acetylglucosamine transferase
VSRHLLVCSGGGHLKQLDTLVDRMGIPAQDQFWVTFDTGLSRTLLGDRDVIFAEYAAPRDTVKILKNANLARGILRSERFETAISTGSSLAVSFLPLAARRGVPAHFIETAARATAPSLTGRILAKDKKVCTYTQYPAWADQRWRYRGSIFDNFEPGPARDVGDIRRAVVTVGTTESYGFDRLVRKLVPLLDGWDVLWQIGNTDVCGYPIEGRVAVPHTELVEAIRKSDVVIAHSGTGAALTALELGKCPVLVPRLAEFGEHVDDHQLQVSEFLSKRKLAIACQVEDLSIERLRLAAGREIRRAVSPPRFELDGRRPSLALLDGEDER